jgi:L-ascorbate metabolism protein UlaG (beta-lactamase superfamily)
MGPRAYPDSDVQPSTHTILLAQEDEGDIDESYDSYGPDIDEEIEYDEALMSPDDALKTEAAPEVEQTAIDSLMKGIKWLGHASFLIEDSIMIYIDPYDLPEGLPAGDIILITHDHRDHFSLADVTRLHKASTVIVSVETVGDALPTKAGDFRSMAPGDTVSVGDVTIEAVPAYNIKKDFHPKDKGWLGFIVNIAGRRIYHAGDTDLIPEMKTIDADIALLPVGGTYTMDAEEAAKAANLIKPKVAIPMHWGKIVGSEDDAKLFKAKCEVPVVILKKEPVKTKTEDE